MDWRLADIIRTHARERGERPVLTFGGRTISYADLHARSSRAAQGLIAEGVAPQDRVAFLDKNGPEYFEVLFGGGMANAVNVAVNWRLAAPEMEYIIHDAEAMVLFVGPDFFPHLEQIALLRSAGRPYPWVELRIVEPDTERDCPRGAVGELWTRSVQNMKGYWNKPEETARAFTADGWLKTGDAGFVDAEGFIFLTDRVKDMIVSGGENVYPIEVENVLVQHPAIEDVAVIGVPHEKWGETVKAIVVRAAGTTPLADEIMAFARERLARFKCPTSVDFLDACLATRPGRSSSGCCASPTGRATSAGSTDDRGRVQHTHAEQEETHHDEDDRARALRGRRSGRGHARRPGPDARRHGHRDQDRQHQPVQRSRLRLRHHRQVDHRLVQEGQRRGRDQRPQDQLHHLRRRLQPAQGRRDGPEAGGTGSGPAPVPDARHAVEHRHPQVHEPAEGAAALRGHRSHQVGRPRRTSRGRWDGSPTTRASPRSTRSTS